jgi:hypothetical protein
MGLMHRGCVVGLAFAGLGGLYRMEAEVLSSIHANVLISVPLLLWQPFADLSFEDKPQFPTE